MDLFWNVTVNLLLLAAGFILLAKGSDFFVEGASSIATRFKIPQLVIGLTIVAMGTSLPEASVSISAALKGSADMAVGNVVGSNILNILIILGISSLITPLVVAPSTIKMEIPIMLGATALLFALGYGGTVSFWGGAGMLACFGAFLALQIYMARRGMAQESKKDELLEKSGAHAPKQAAKQPRLWISILFTVIGCGAIILGSECAVDGATAIAKVVGISDHFIGLTVVALGTSLPELFTSVTAALKKNADIAIGNIVGSNIFNILFILGAAAVIVPVPFQPLFRVDTVVAFVAGIVLLAFSLGKKRQLGRVGGAVMLLFYAAYFAYLVTL
ncbi:MAG: calcium/sodium antiporter [Clostridia bacterium]|nr:calcium/sodium antiporter [Clostridia bacterium]